MIRSARLGNLSRSATRCLAGRELNFSECSAEVSEWCDRYLSFGLKTMLIRRPNLPQTLAIILFLAGCLPSLVLAEAKQTNAIESIKVEQLRRYVDFLASDSLEGRESGKRGGKASGAYLKTEIKRIGIPGGMNNGLYFQSFRYEYRNVLAYLEGSDDRLKHEVIIVGGHYDHVGYGNRTNSYGPYGQIHNGADDNASGVAVILEMMEAFTLQEQRPRRSILFAFWDAEERGLYGSKHWIQNPTVPLNNVVFTVNADMVGRLRPGKFGLFGWRSAKRIRRLFSEANSDAEFDVDFTWDMQPDSDHWPFYERAIPSLMLHTGKHDDYHRPSDDVDKINYQGMRHIARTTFRFVDHLANTNDLPRFRRDSWNENLAQQRQADAEWAAPEARFGVSWDLENQQKNGVVKLTGIARGYPADRAGMYSDDQIVKFWGIDLRKDTDFRALVNVAPTDVPVVIRRDGEDEKTLNVRLFGRRSPLGLGWDTNEAEPNSLIVKRVVDGTPANLAGLQVNDRIYGINGQNTNSSQAVASAIQTASKPIELIVEHNGRVRTVEVVPFRHAAEQRNKSDKKPDDDASKPKQ